MPIVNMTQQMLVQLKCPTDKTRIEYCDKDLPGLLLEVRPSGAGTFHLRYKANNTTKYVKLGTSDLITLAEARKKAKTLKAEIALGADPRGEQKKQKAVMLFSNYMEEYFLPYVKQRLRSWYSYESIYRVHLKAEYGDIPINKITRKQIVDFHTRLKDSGLSDASCNHIGVKLLKRALNHSIDIGLIEGPNPATRVQQFQELNQVENILDQDQLEKLLTILRTDSNRPVCLILMYLLSTGARLNEALSAKWEHVNREHRTWRIPASNAKSKRMRVIPLNNSAMDVLNQLDTEGVYEHLFVNKQRSIEIKKEAPYTTITKVWDRIRNKAGIPHFRIHDARHLFCSWLVSSGVPIFSVMTLAGHANVKTTQRYSHLSTKTLQEASSNASVIIQGAMGRSMQPKLVEQDVPADDAELEVLPAVESPVRELSLEVVTAK